MYKHSILIFFILIFLSCKESEDCCFPLEEQVDIIGEWQIYEEGYSPGFEYIVEDVPAFPPQLLNFKSDNVFWSNVEGLDEFSYYKVFEDPFSDGKIVALFDENPIDVDVTHLKYSYNLEQYLNGYIKLSFRFCFEGCHIGLRQVD